MVLAPRGAPSSSRGGPTRGTTTCTIKEECEKERKRENKLNLET